MVVTDVIRSYGIFDAMYNVTFGLNIYALNEPTSVNLVGVSDKPTWLPKPTFDEYKEVEDFTAAAKEVKGFYSAKGSGWNTNAGSADGVYMTLEAHWNATSKLSEPDILRINMTVEVPAAYATGTPADTLTQFFSMKKMGGYGV